MGSSIIYSPMNRYIETKIKIRHIIPYKTNRSTKYECSRVYYNAYWNMSFQVLSVKYDKDNNLDEAEVRWDDGCYGIICTDISPGEDYILVKDYKKAYQKKNIINTDDTYTGAEIIYWFYLQGASILDNKYKGFWEYIDYFSKNRIQDNNQYRVYGTLRHGVWKNCKIKRMK